MFISTIIPTIGRSTLSRAVYSVLDQDFTDDDFEVIVVNDLGEPLIDEEWQRSSKVRVINTNQHNRSVARNAGAAIAKGRYLHFLDDDDWMVAGAFKSFWDLANSSHAAWLYGAFRLVDNDGNNITEIIPDEIDNCFIQLIAWEWLPLQASIIESNAFFSVGGFAPLQSLCGGFEDVDLSRQISCYHDMARTETIVTCIRVGDVGSTTNYIDMFRQNRKSREKSIDMPGAFARMRKSARVNPSVADYWCGKIVYYYLASAKWHLQRKRLFTAFSRCIYTLAGFVTAGHHNLTADFWRGVSRPHYPRMGNALIEASANHLYSETRANIGL